MNDSVPADKMILTHFLSVFSHAAQVLKHVEKALSETIGWKLGLYTLVIINLEISHFQNCCWVIVFLNTRRNCFQYTGASLVVKGGFSMSQWGRGRRDVIQNGDRKKKFCLYPNASWNSPYTIIIGLDNDIHVGFQTDDDVSRKYYRTVFKGHFLKIKMLSFNKMILKIVTTMF